jgi:hypothetical protein
MLLKCNATSTFLVFFWQIFWKNIFAQKRPFHPLFIGIKSCFGAGKFGRTFTRHFSRQKTFKN